LFSYELFIPVFGYNVTAYNACLVQMSNIEDKYILVVLESDVFIRDKISHDKLKIILSRWIQYFVLGYFLNSKSGDTSVYVRIKWWHHALITKLVIFDQVQ